MKGPTIAILLIFVLIAVFFYQSGSLAQVTNQIDVTVFERQWTGIDTFNPINCGVVSGPAFSSNQIHITSATFATGSCNPGDSYVQVSTDAGDWEEIEVDFTWQAFVGNAEQNPSRRGYGYFTIGGYGYVHGPEVTGTYNTGGTLRYVKNSAGTVDVFLNECLSCSERFVKNVAYSSDFLIKSGVGYSNEANARSELRVTRFEVTEDDVAVPDPGSPDLNWFDKIKSLLSAWWDLIRGVF